MASGINTALTNAQQLQTRLCQKFGELKRPVIAKARSSQELEDEERGLKSMQEKLNTLEKKLRIFRDLDTNKADERAGVMTSLDGARRELLSAAREFEAHSFGSKDVIQSIMDFCQLKQAQADASPRVMKPSFKANIMQQPRRDDQPQLHPDQSERSARRYSSGNVRAQMPAVTVSPLPSNLGAAASRRYSHSQQQPPPPPPPPPQQQEPAQQQQPPSMASKLPRWPAADSAAPAAAAAPSLNIKVPKHEGTAAGNAHTEGAAGSESDTTTPTAASAAAQQGGPAQGGGLSRASSLPKPPGAGTAGAAAPSPPTTPALNGEGADKQQQEHSPQMTQDSSLCNMESMCGAGTYPGETGTAGGGLSAKAKALTLHNGQDTASSIPAPPPAPARSRMLDAYIAATNSGEKNSGEKNSGDKNSSSGKLQDVMVEQRGSELTLGHVIAQPPEGGILRPSQVRAMHASAGSRATADSSASSLTLPTTAAQSPVHPKHNNGGPSIFSKRADGQSADAAGHSAEQTKGGVGAEASTPAKQKGGEGLCVERSSGSGSGQSRECVEKGDARPAPSATHTPQAPRQPQPAHITEQQHVVLSPALSSTRSSSPKLNTADADVRASGSSSASGTSQGGKSPSTSRVAMLQQQFLRQQTGGKDESTHASKEPKEPATPNLTATPKALSAFKPHAHAPQQQHTQQRSSGSSAAAAITAASHDPSSVHARVRSPRARSGAPEGAATHTTHTAAATGNACGNAHTDDNEAQRTTARAPPPASLVQARAALWQGTGSGSSASGNSASTPASRPVGSGAGVGVGAWTQEKVPEREGSGTVPPAPAKPDSDANSSGAAVPTAVAQQQQQQWRSDANSSGAAAAAAAAATAAATAAAAAAPAGAQGAPPAPVRGEAGSENAKAAAGATQQQQQQQQQQQRAGGVTPNTGVGARGAGSAAANLKPLQLQDLGLLPQHAQHTQHAQHAQQQSLLQPRSVAPLDQQLLLQPRARTQAPGHAHAGGAGGAHAAPPPSVLAAGPQLAAAGIVSVPHPTHAAARARTHLRDCDVWEEEEEGYEEGWDSADEQQQRGRNAQRRRHTVHEVGHDSAQQNQRGGKRGQRGVSAHHAHGRGKKGRGVWGGILRVLGITTTVASVVVVTGAAVFAAAALNTGLDELDLMHPAEAGRVLAARREDPFKRKVQRMHCAQGGLKHPDALAAGRG